jgi:hypothetical protein
MLLAAVDRGQERRVAWSALIRPVSARLIRGIGALVPVPDVLAG